MAYRRAWKTRNLNGLVYGEEPQLDLPDEYSRADERQKAKKSRSRAARPRGATRSPSTPGWTSSPATTRWSPLSTRCRAGRAAPSSTPCARAERGDEATLHDLRQRRPATTTMTTTMTTMKSPGPGPSPRLSPSPRLRPARTARSCTRSGRRGRRGGCCRSISTTSS